MVAKKTIKPILMDIEPSDNSLRNKNHLKFFVDRSSETVERTLSIIQKLQQEINQLKDGLAKADNEFRNLNRLVQDDKKKIEN
jgi:hypothetical protein